MKNLNALDEDSLDSLPSRERSSGENRYRHGDGYPYRRVERFLDSRVGTPWDRVVSEFVHADWIPARRRQASELSRDVATNTFLDDDGDVCYYEKYSWRCASEKKVKNATRKTLYVHPTTKILSVFHPHKRPDYRTVQRREQAKYMRVLGDYHQLLKLEGIWYEVKAEPAKSDVVEIGGLHYKIVRDIPSPDADYKIVDGKILVPTVHSKYSGVTIDPKDQLIETDPNPDARYYWKRPNFSSIRIIYCRQLNHKSLKKHGVHNDVPELGGARCKECGGVNCKQAHNKRCPICGERWCRKHG